MNTANLSICFQLSQDIKGYDPVGIFISKAGIISAVNGDDLALLKGIEPFH